MDAASNAVIVASSRENSCRPRWNAVCSCRSPSSSAIRPRPSVGPSARRPRVRRPRARRAHERDRWEIEGRLALGDRPDRLLGGGGLACQHGLIALEVAGLDQPQVRRHDVADVQDDDVTGDDVVTSTSVAAPSRSTVARRRIWECRAATACSDRYSLKKPSATLSARIARMIAASVPSPTVAR